jgi:hypothetical protein
MFTMLLPYALCQDIRINMFHNYKSVIFNMICLVYTVSYIIERKTMYLFSFINQNT